MKNKFSTLLKEERVRSGMTQKELSKFLGIPKRTIENWEEAVSVPDQFKQEAVLSKIKELQKNA